MRAADTNVPTNLPATALVTDGPFRTTRNPIYIGLALSFLGLSSLLDAPTAMLMLVPCLMVLHAGVVLREERYLEQKFGDDYWRVVKGEGSCNAERLAARQKAHDDGAWVREAASAYAEKRAARLAAEKVAAE